MSYTLPRKFYIIAVMGKKVCSRENGYHTLSIGIVEIITARVENAVNKN